MKILKKKNKISQATKKQEKNTRIQAMAFRGSAMQICCFQKWYNKRLFGFIFDIEASDIANSVSGFHRKFSARTRNIFENKKKDKISRADVAVDEHTRKKNYQLVIHDFAPINNIQY